MGFLKSLFGGKEESAEEKAEKSRARDFDVLKYDGIRALRMGEADYAIQCFKKALALSPDHETMSALAEALLAAGEPEEAYQTLSDLAVQFPGNINVRLSMARIADRLGDYERMQADCLEALKIDDGHAGALYLSGKASHAAGDTLNAIALLTRALTADEHLDEARLLRADILAAMGTLEEAEKDIDMLLQPQEGATPSEEALLRKAGLRLQQNDPEQAIAYYNKVKEQNPLMGEAYVGLSMAYAANRQLDRSLETMDEALEYMPDFGTGYKERGRIKMLLNDKAGAMDDLKQALEADPETAKELEGHFSNLEHEMDKAYKSRNPFGF